MIRTIHFEDFHTGEFIPVEIIPLEEFDAGVLVSGSEINIIAGVCDWRVAANIFHPIRGTDLFLEIPRDLNWAQLLAALKVFPSKTQALKNWMALKRDLNIQEGFETIHLGKARKIEVHIWKPMHPPAETTPA